MNFDLLKDATRYYKENPKGVESMCRTFEEIRDDATKAATINSIKKLMEKLKYTAKQAMDFMDIPDDQQAEYAEKLSS